MNTEAKGSGLPARRIHLVVAIDRFLARLASAAPPASWVVKGGYANQLRRPGEARFTEDLDLRIDADIDEAPFLMATGFAADLGDDFGFEAQSPAVELRGPPGGGLRFVVVTRLAGLPVVTFKADVSSEDVVVGNFETYVSDPVIARLGLQTSRFPVYPVAQHVAEKLHALTLPREAENTRARDLVDLAWFSRHFTFKSNDLEDACRATFAHRNTHAWPPTVPKPPAEWKKPYQRWRDELQIPARSARDCAVAVTEFFTPVFEGSRGLSWNPERSSWDIDR